MDRQRRSLVWTFTHCIVQWLCTCDTSYCIPANRNHASLFTCQPFAWVSIWIRVIIWIWVANISSHSLVATFFLSSVVLKRGLCCTWGRSPNKWETQTDRHYKHTHLHTCMNTKYTDTKYFLFLPLFPPGKLGPVQYSFYLRKYGT